MDAVTFFYKRMSAKEQVEIWNLYCESEELENDIYVNDRENFEMIFTDISEAVLIMGLSHDEYDPDDEWVKYDRDWLVVRSANDPVRLMDKEAVENWIKRNSAFITSRDDYDPTEECEFTALDAFKAIGGDMQGIAQQVRTYNTFASATGRPCIRENTDAVLHKHVHEIELLAKALTSDNHHYKALDPWCVIDAKGIKSASDPTYLMDLEAFGKWLEETSK